MTDALRSNGAPPRPAPSADDDEFEKLLKGNNIDSIVSADLNGKDKIMHADGALDFESEDELADDEDENEAEPAKTSATPADKEDWADFEEDLNIFDEENEDETNEADNEATREQQEAERKSMELAQLQEWYPGFEPHVVLRMNKLFGPDLSDTVLPQPQGTRPLYLLRMRLDVQPEQSSKFNKEDDEAVVVTKGGVGVAKRVKQLGLQDVHRIETELGKQPNFLLPVFAEAERVSRESVSKIGKALKDSNKEQLQLEVSNWDDVLDLSDSTTDEVGGAHIAEMHFDDHDIYDSDVESAILDNRPLSKRPKLDLNDQHLLFVEDRKLVATTHMAMFRGMQHHPPGHPAADMPQLMNISNDRAYDMLRANYQRKVRSTIGSLNIDHSMAALRLQSPFYKVQLNKSQLRAWGRQKLNIKPGTTLTFSSTKARKKRRDKNKLAHEIFARSSDLSLGDNAPLFLIEFSEETPLVLSGFGMGSKLINYYRKKSEDDKTRPKLPIGETHVLDLQDRSAFWNFGFIEPGNVVPTLYNQMIRAPVFQHQAKPTDFLLIKSTTRARGVKYFLRQIPYQFVCGQVFPAVPIPGPHSRKKTTASKNRLKMVAYRALNKAPNNRIQVKEISQYFPEFNEVQNRQRLKDFMIYQRSGDDQGFWKVKPGETLPTEDEIRQMITPEDVMQLESMLVGEQHLKDTSYSKPFEEEEEETEEGGSIEEQLAPWNISRNFINAVQGKAMLQLNGVGDPTQRGEGFSFLRTSMKGGFTTEFSAEDEKKLNGHSYNVALQQKAYDEEIRRIWYSQKRSLSVNDPSRLPEANKLPDPSNQTGVETPSTVSGDKVLQITRVIRDENDVLVRRTELVTDPQVIRAYLRCRKAAEEEKMAVDSIAVSNDAEMNKNRQKFLEQELARLKRNADRRKARKATKQDAKLKATTRKCATCGMVGHIKTNKQCPMYNDIFLSASNGSSQN